MVTVTRRVPPSAYEIVNETAKAHRSADEIIKAVFDLTAEAAVYAADDVLYTAAEKLDDLAADLESYDDSRPYAAVLRAACEGVTRVHGTAKVRLKASTRAGGDVPVGGDAAGVTVESLRSAYLSAGQETRDGFARWMLSAFGIDGTTPPERWLAGEPWPGWLTAGVTRPCACGCGLPVTSGRAGAKFATSACRQRAFRAERARRLREGTGGRG